MNLNRYAVATSSRKWTAGWLADPAQEVGALRARMRRCLILRQGASPLKPRSLSLRWYGKDPEESVKGSQSRANPARPGQIPPRPKQILRRGKGDPCSGDRLRRRH